MSTDFVVDDAENCTRVLARLLRSRGYHVVCAANGLEALEALESEIPALVLLDLSMPVMDGVGFLKAIHSEPRWATLPVIIVSGEDRGSSLRAADELAGREVLVKSKFSAEQLFASIRRHVHA